MLRHAPVLSGGKKRVDEAFALVPARGGKPGARPTGSVVRRRLDGRENAAEEFGERVGAQGHAGDDAEPAAAPLERPEEGQDSSRRWRS